MPADPQPEQNPPTVPEGIVVTLRLIRAHAISGASGKATAAIDVLCDQILAALSAADAAGARRENEECAKLCDRFAESWKRDDETRKFVGGRVTGEQVDICESLATQIRSRSPR